MRKKLINGNFLRSDIKGTFSLFQGSMDIENGVIVGFDTKTGETTNAIDLKNNLVLPTFNNQHLHLGETVFRPLPYKMTLLDYIAYTEQQNKMFGDKKDGLRLLSASTTLAEALRTGTTEISTIRGLNELATFPIKAKSGYPIMQSEKLGHLLDSGIKGFDEFYKFCVSQGIEPGVFLHSFYANDENSIKVVQQILDKYNCFLAIHVAEDLQSEELVKAKWGGKNSVQLLKKFNLFSPNTNLVHCGVAREEELLLVKESGSQITVCPLSSNTLQTPYANPITLETMGIDWHIASDGLATGQTADLIKQAQTIKDDFPQISYQTLLSKITAPHTITQNQDATFLTFDTAVEQDVESTIANVFTKNELSSIFIKGEEYGKH